MNVGEDRLSEQIYHFNNLQKDFILKRLTSMNLNEQQARTLNYIANNPGTIQKDLANYLGKQTATVTNILKGLEAKAYISREIPSNNERQKRLYLTAEGKNLVDLVQQIFFDLEAVLTSSISESDKKNVRDILKYIGTKL
ncbi:MarR family winged helix-turn-helix transcriptional regulator [Gottfriedia sp. NPDC056225]|uniref:MarR family winged helix-turn-helix transcriptional regulator n=1 Tax=Gottfriedia sp. NPDC056225 TaxID=3345751 RepID=UPI0035E2E310